MRALAVWPAALLLASRAAGQVFSFNRTAGEVEVGTCEGLKKNAELGIDISVVVTDNLRCAETITVQQGVHLSIRSAADESYLVAIAEDFAAPDPTSASLLVNPEGSHLSLDRLTFANEAGAGGSPGVARAVWNRGRLEVNGCYFAGLNYASQQDGGAIYSTADLGGTSGGAFVSVRNSTFEGNIAANHGGAIASFGEGEMELSKCTFAGNEAVGAGDYRRSGSGGAVYASAGVFVTVLNSSFEGCLGRYGGAALFTCGADVFESTFDGNEATGLFGAIVNGDLSDAERADATLSYGAPAPGENYTCPPLFVSGTLFKGNIASSGYGGAIASIDSSVSVFNTSMVETFGGAVYFGTSADDDRDQLEMELIQFNLNEASSSSPSLVGSAFLIERMGTPVSNTTGHLEVVDTPASSSSSSSSGPPATVQQSVGGSAGDTIGVVRDVYCFQNSPYECEAYFGGGNDADIAVQLAGTFRCNGCKGAAFTGMGSAEGAPVPPPVEFDDDDGLSKMGQERAQGGTPSPAAPGSPDAGETGDLLGEESEPELLGANGGMRWVVVGLIVGIGGALLVCMCLLTVCRTTGRKNRTARRLESLHADDEGSLGGAAMVGPRSSAASVAGHAQERGFGSGGGGGIVTHAQFFATSPRTSAAADVNAESCRTVAATGTTSQRLGGSGDVSHPNSARRPGGSGDVSRSNSARRPGGSGDVSHSNSTRRPGGSGDLSRSNSARRPGGSGDLSRSNSARRPGGSGDLSRSNSARRSGGSGDLSHSNWRRPSGTDMSSSNSRRPSATDSSGQNSRRPSATGSSRPTSRRPSATESSRQNSRRPSATESSRPNSRRPSGRVAGEDGRDPRRDTSDSTVAVVNEMTPHASQMRDLELARQRSIEMTSEERWGSPPLVSAWGKGVPVGGAGHVVVSTKSTPTKQGFTALEDEQNYYYQEKPHNRGRSRDKHGGGGGGATRAAPWDGPLADFAHAAAEAAAQVTAVPRGRKQERSRGRGSGTTSRRHPSAREAGSEPVAVAVERRPSRSAEREAQQQQQQFHPTSRSRTRMKLPGDSPCDLTPERVKADRALSRAVKTPAGGARLSISAVTSTPGTAVGGASKGTAKGRGRVNASGKAVAAAAAAAVAGAATELEASGEFHTRRDSTIVSSEENPVYSHDRSDAAGTKRSNSRSRFRISSQSPVRRSNSSRRSDSMERGGGAVRGGGLASELFRISPAPKKDRSAKVYSGKFDASRSDWSADGEVEWNRHSPAVRESFK
eukprot:g15912.t1